MIPTADAVVSMLYGRVAAHLRLPTAEQHRIDDARCLPVAEMFMLVLKARAGTLDCTPSMSDQELRDRLAAGESVGYDRNRSAA